MQILGSVGGDYVIVMGELGMIRDNLHESIEERESRDLEEALAISLSLAPLADESRLPARSKPAPPLPPVVNRPAPPEEEPSNHARMAAVQRLPVIFPPVGHHWNRSALASAAQRAPARRRRWRRAYRVFPADPESFRYFPPTGSGYERLRRRRYQPAPVTFDSNTETEESRGDAPPVVSTASPYRSPYEPWERGSRFCDDSPFGLETIPNSRPLRFNELLIALFGGFPERESVEF